MKMNRKLLTVLATLVILGAAVGCNKKNDAALTETNDKQETMQVEQQKEAAPAQTSVTAAGTESYDYSKILKGDFSEFAGTWVSSNGKIMLLKADGTLANIQDRQKYGGFTEEDRDGSSYQWTVNLEGNGTFYALLLYPIGADIYDHYGDRKLVQSDKTKVRIATQEKDFKISEIYYQGASGSTGASNKSYDYEKILKGNLSDFTGIWKNGNGENRTLRKDGTFVKGQKASGFTSQNNPKQAAGGDFYMWGVNTPEGGGFAVSLFPAGVDVMGYDGIIKTDKTKVRLTMGQDLPSSSTDVFYLE
jgi:hypothetical protein